MTAVSLLMKYQLLLEMAADPAVKSSAVEVAAVLLNHRNSRTGQCNPSYARLAAATGLNRDTVVVAIQTLEGAGFLKVDRSAAQRGQGLPTNSFEFDFGKLDMRKIPTTPSRKFRLSQSEIPTTSPENSDHPQSEKPTTPGRKSRPKSEKEETDKFESGNLNHACDEPSLPIQLPALSAPIPKPRQKRAPANIECDFREFMRQYPKPEDEDAARKAYKRALKRAAVSDLLNGAMRYAAEKQGCDPQYIKTPRNWLDAGSWKNPPRPPQSGAPSHHDQQLAQIAGFYPSRASR